MNAAELKKSMASCVEGITWLVLEGDFGGQIYLTVRLDKLGEGASSTSLLLALDKAAWASNEGVGRDVYLVTTNNPDEGVIGGMGGGKLIDGVWLHKEIHINKWRKAIRTALRLDDATRISH